MSRLTDNSCMLLVFMSSTKGCRSDTEHLKSLSGHVSFCAHTFIKREKNFREGLERAEKK